MLKIRQKPRVRERIFLTVPEFEGACLKVTAGGTTRVVGWQPYEVDITDALAETDEIAAAPPRPVASIATADRNRA